MEKARNSDWSPTFFQELLLDEGAHLLHERMVDQPLRGPYFWLLGLWRIRSSSTLPRTYTVHGPAANFGKKDFFCTGNRNLTMDKNELIEDATLLMARHAISSMIGAYTSIIWHWCHLAWQASGPEPVQYLP